jgi:TonB-linked SusC/RagA family outer membrane protein
MEKLLHNVTNTISFPKSGKLSTSFKQLFILFSFFCMSLTSYSHGSTIEEQAVTGTPIIISGTVTDENGIAMPGVSVAEKGIGFVTVTDSDGKYKVQVKEVEIKKGYVLVFSFIGFSTQEIQVLNNSTIDVVLKEDLKSLNEVVVVAYGSQEKKTITGSQVSVVSTQLQNIPMTSVDQMLQGKVAGLQSVAFTGQPGANQQIRIRGIGSISASADPLYVIDGIPVNSGDLSSLTTTSNTLAGINPNDIENVTVLKDAASASIYGSRAANGVILITTKKGKEGKTKILSNIQYGFSTPIIPKQGKPLNKAQYDSLTSEGLINGGYATDKAGALAILDSNLGASNGYDIDWLKQVSRTGRTQQYDASVQGGDNKTTFFISGSYLKQEATVIASQFSRLSTSLNLTHKINEKLSLGAKINISGTNQMTPSNSGSYSNPVQAAYDLRPDQNPFNQDGTYNISLETFPDVYNPVAQARYNKNKLFMLRGLSNAFLDYSPIKNLTLTSRISIDYTGLNEYQYANPLFGDGLSTSGSGTAFDSRYFNWDWTNMATYRLNLNAENDFYADFKIGYEAQKSSTYTVNASSVGFPSNTSLIYSVVASKPVTAQAGGSDWSVASEFSNAVINYKNRYSLTGSFRRDGSSRFGNNNRYGNFWSAGIAWNVDEEEFFKNFSQYVSTFKIRTSYGVNGNNAPRNYQWRPTYSYGNNYNSLPGSYPSNVGNNNLTWEVNKPYDAGIDAGFLNERIRLTADYYIRKTNKLLLDVPLSRTGGYSSYIDNVGAMENKGWEFTIGVTPVKSQFVWDVNFNIAFNKNKITALNSTQNQYIDGYFIRKVGENFQTFYMPEYAGVDSQTGDALWFKNSVNSDGTIDHSKTSNYNEAEFTQHGSASPKYFGGLSNTFSYKGITLDAQFTYSFGSYIYDPYALYFESDGAYANNNQFKIELERWQKPGDITNVPKYVYNNSSNSNALSTRYLHKGDYIRLRNISLSYEIPKNIISKLKLDRVNVYLRGTNFWTKTFDKHLFYDPEQGIDGTANLNVFMSKTISFGLIVGI